MAEQDKTQTIALLQAARRKDKAKYNDKLDATEAKFKVHCRGQNMT